MEKFYSEGIPPWNYNPLWKTMEKRNVSQYKLLQMGIDNHTLNSLKKNKNITILTIYKLCDILKCTANDIVEFPNIQIEKD